MILKINIYDLEIIFKLILALIVFSIILYLILKLYESDLLEENRYILSKSSKNIKTRLKKANKKYFAYIRKEVKK